MRAMAPGSRISAIWLSVFPAISASSNSAGPGSGASPTPVTFAPMAVSQSAAHPPLKPVWPVRSTRLPRQKAGSGLVEVGVSSRIGGLFTAGAPAPLKISTFQTPAYQPGPARQDCRAGQGWGQGWGLTGRGAPAKGDDGV